MMDSFEPMRIIDISDDLQLVGQTKGKRVKFPVDSDKHLVLIRGSKAVPSNLITEYATGCVFVDTEVAVQHTYNPNLKLPQVHLPTGDEVQQSVFALPQCSLMAEEAILDPVIPLPSMNKELDLQMGHLEPSV